MAKLKPTVNKKDHIKGPNGSYDFESMVGAIEDPVTERGGSLNRINSY
jgi:hypothetical protein